MIVYYLRQPSRPNKPIIGFVTGTPILTPEGHKPIEQFRPGDVIPGRSDKRPVKENRNMFPTRKPILTLRLSGKVIRTTANHPFYVSGQGWTNAADLHVGDLLRSVDGRDVPIDAVTHEGVKWVVYSMDAGEGAQGEFN